MKYANKYQNKHFSPGFSEGCKFAGERLIRGMTEVEIYDELDNLNKPVKLEFDKGVEYALRFKEQYRRDLDD